MIKRIVRQQVFISVVKHESCALRGMIVVFINCPLTPATRALFSQRDSGCTPAMIDNNDNNNVREEREKCILHGNESAIRTQSLLIVNCESERVSRPDTICVSVYDISREKCVLIFPLKIIFQSYETEET